MSQLLSSIQYIWFRKVSGSNVGWQTCFLPWAPFKLVTLLYGTRALLFCHSVWPSCYVTIPQLCHNAWWCWRNTPDLLHISLLGKGLCWCSFAVCECMGRKIEVQETVKKAFIFFQTIFAPPVKVAPMSRAMPAIP